MTETTTNPTTETAQAGGHHHTVNAVLEDLAPCKRLLKVSVPAEEVAKEIQGQLADLRRSVKIKGFRPGKVPAPIVAKLYGDNVKEEVKKHLLEHAYFIALKDKKVEPSTILGESRVENLKFGEKEGLSFEVTLQLRPVFTLPEYKGIEVRLPALKVSEEDVEKAIDGFRRSRGEIRPIEDKGAVVEADDTVNCDVQVWLAEEWEAQGEAEGDDAKVKPLKEFKDQEITLSVDKVAGLDVEDLGDSLVGLKVGEEGEVETTLPADFEVVEGRGEAATVVIKVTGLKRLFLPPLTDEWVKESGYDSAEDLKREAREDMFRQKELARTSEIETKVLDALVEKAGAFDLPGDLIEAEVRDAERRRVVELRMEGKSEDEAKRLVLDESGELRDTVVSNLRYFFILDEIAKKEKIRINESDMDARIARIAQASGKAPAEVRKHFEERDVLPQLRHELMNEKTRAFLRESAKVVDRAD